MAHAADTAAPVNKVRLVQNPVPASALTAPAGFVGVRYKANLEGSLKGFDINAHVRMMEERKTRDWWWIGEQPGKWLESSVLSSTLARDAAFADQTRAILARVLKAQSADGYLGISDPAALTPEKPLRGMDPYEQYFTFHGLITAYEVFGDKAALQAAVKLGDYYLNHIGPGKAEFWPSPVRPPGNRNRIICPQWSWVPPGTPQSPELYVHSSIAGHTAHYGWEGTLVIDPILRLYQATGESRFLDWARWVVSRMDTWSGWDAFSRLDEVAEGKIGVHQLQPYVHSHTFQMNFLGFLRLYQATGDTSLLRKVEGAWKDIVARQIYITGGVSVGEHYEAGYNRPVEGAVVETCANMSWMELNQYLLELTGDPKYAEIMERLLINHVFAAQTVDGDCFRYHTPPNGLKPVEFFHGPDCCTASGHRLVSKLPLFFYGQSESTAIINQYVPSSATIALGGGRKVELRQETRYPEEEQILVRVHPSSPEMFTVRLRIPGWCTSPAVAVNSAGVSGVTPGAYLDIKRLWKVGDTLQLNFPMKPAWVAHDHLAPEQARWALTCGPLVYALDNLWWDSTEVAFPHPVERALAVKLDLQSGIRKVTAPAGLLGPAFRAKVTTATGAVVEPLFVPFANVGRWYKDASASPDRNAAAYSYAVWLFDENAAAFKSISNQEKELATARRNAIDLVQIGNDESERAHDLQGDSTTGPFKNRVFRHGRDFNWKLKVRPEAATDLVVTYWGSDVRREFNVLIDGQALVVQKLENNHPGEFFELRYRIPLEATKGRTDALGQKVHSIRAGFTTRNQDVAGGVFGIRTEPGK